MRPGKALVISWLEVAPLQAENLHDLVTWSSSSSKAHELERSCDRGRSSGEQDSILPNADEGILKKHVVALSDRDKTAAGQHPESDDVVVVEDIN
jgi:hypothetical protein